MPYMTCNGRTVSRYDTSEEVGQCKKQEELVYTKQYELCSANPECLADREFRNDVSTGFIVAIVLVLCALFLTLDGGIYHDVH